MIAILDFSPKLKKALKNILAKKLKVNHENLASKASLQLDDKDLFNSDYQDNSRITS